MKYNLSKEYRNYGFRDDQLFLTGWEATGRDLDELLDNCLVSVENMFGNEVSSFKTLGDLPSHVIDAIMDDVKTELHKANDKYYERMRGVTRQHNN